jgi:hypothetical protein
MNFVSRKAESFKEWWNAPPTTDDRFKSSLLSGFAGFWLGGLGRLILGPSSSSIEILFYYAVAGVLVGIVLGATFPKVMRIVAFPFAFFGFGSGT